MKIAKSTQRVTLINMVLAGKHLLLTAHGPTLNSDHYCQQLTV